MQNSPTNDIVWHLINGLFDGPAPELNKPLPESLSPEAIADALPDGKLLADGALPENLKQIRLHNRQQAKDFIRSADQFLVWSLVRSAAWHKFFLIRGERRVSQTRVQEMERCSTDVDELNLSFHQGVLSSSEESLEIAKANIDFVDSHCPVALPSPIPPQVIKQHRQLLNSSSN